MNKKGPCQTHVTKAFDICFHYQQVVLKKMSSSRNMYSPVHCYIY